MSMKSTFGEGLLNSQMRLKDGSLSAVFSAPQETSLVVTPVIIQIPMAPSMNLQYRVRLDVNCGMKSSSLMASYRVAHSGAGGIPTVVSGASALVP